MMFKRGIVIALLALFVSASIPQEVAAKGDKKGYIYGVVTTRTGNTYEGVLRWGDEEAFWDDLFNSAKEDQPYAKWAVSPFQEEANEEAEEVAEEADDLEKEAAEIEEEALSFSKSDDSDDQREAKDLYIQVKKLRKEAKYMRREADRIRTRVRHGRGGISFLGGAINIGSTMGYSSRQFTARFGDISKIEVIGSEDAEVTMKSGSVIVVSGEANDVGGPILVQDKMLGEIEVPWKKINTIEFKETPEDAVVKGERLNGTIICDAGEFTGQIQWDSQECLTTDKLDGESDDGTVAIPMGNITKIKRRNSSSCRVTLTDGRELILDGTNDVNSSIRGIYVNDDKYGRVKVAWDSFEELTFKTDVRESGKGYKEYKKGKKLEAVVIDENEKSYKGRIAYDLDEDESWEILNGNKFDVEFFIPFEKIESIKPRSRSASMVYLRNGEKLRLDSSNDISSDNDGILVFVSDNEDDAVYISWDKVNEIKFTW